MRISGTDTPVRDLTRWNRAGLDRFRYVEGGAAEWLEYLRVAHMLLYAGNLAAAPTDDPDTWRAAFETGTLPGGLDIAQAVAELAPKWAQPAPQAYLADTGDYPAALRAQYDTIPLDHAAQISRAFSRAFHILTETLDAYANEGFLATATQEPHLRRLLEMIDYHPRLPASARMVLALILKEDAPRQVLDAGLAVEHLPSDGTAILTFETLSPLEVDPALNLMRPVGWDQRSDPIPHGATTFTVADATVLNHALSGKLALLQQDGEWEGLEVKSASKAAAQVTVARGTTPIDATYQQAKLHLAPADIRPIRPTGPNWVHFEDVPRAYVGQLVSMTVSTILLEQLDWVAKTATMTMTGPAIEAARMRISGGASITEAAEEMTRATAIDYGEIADIIVDTGLGGFGFYPNQIAQVMEVRGRDVRLSVTPPAGLVGLFPVARSVVKTEDDQAVLGPYVISETAEPLGNLVKLDGQYLHIDGEPPTGLAEGSPIALRMQDGTVTGGTALGFDTDENGSFHFKMTLPAGKSPEDVSEMAAGFGAVASLTHDIRATSLLFPDPALAVLRLPRTAADTLLKSGRSLLIAPDPADHDPDRETKAMAVTIDSVERSATETRLTLAEDIAALASFRRGYSVVYGNAAGFGHGKSLPEQVLGSGDAAITGQVMDLPSGTLSTRPDPGFPGGIVADITIKAGDRQLKQVSDAREADPMQPSYVLEVADDGSARVRFLSRLPTGTDNIKLTRFRQGAGAAGNNVPAFAIAKTTPKHPAIASVIQPLAPQFGADLEDASALRRQGGSHFALLDRALSPDDFARLAEGMTQVWHAHAELRRGAGSLGRPRIALTVVPAGGGGLEPIRDEVTGYLLDRALPGTILDLAPFTPAPFKLRITVTLRAGYPRDATLAEAIQTAIASTFGLESRALGRTLYVTEITALVEAREEVANSHITLTPDWPAAAIRRLVTAADDTVQAVIPRDTASVHIAAPEDIEVIWATTGGSSA